MSCWCIAVFASVTCLSNWLFSSFSWSTLNAASARHPAVRSLWFISSRMLSCSASSLLLMVSVSSSFLLSRCVERIFAS